MEQGLGSESIPASGSFDKSRVLSIKPLRCLVPIFPSLPGMSSSSSTPAAPFMGISPAGPFPPGVAPFYPFYFPTDQNNQTPSSQPRPWGFNSAIPSPVPINSFRTPTAHANGNGRAGSSRRGTRNSVNDEEYSDSQNPDDPYGHAGGSNKKAGKRKGGPRGSYKKRKSSGQDGAHDVDVEAVIDDFLTSFNLKGFETCIRPDGDTELVRYIVMMFNLLRRRIFQVEDANEATAGITKRPDLKASTVLMGRGVRTNIRKRVGSVPGVEIGDIFFFRMEMCLVGLHAPSMAGIDYMGLKASQDEEPMAVSIVSSGGYEDKDDDPDVLVYSGQGGNANRKDKDIHDQKLERGNLALEKSLHRGNEVRVIRGVRDEANPTGKVYIYDGLYKIQQSWVERGKSGCNIFKYKLLRIPGQPEAFKLWKSIQQWKDGITSRVGVILPDLTSGAEKIPVSLVNDVDGEKGPAYFTYFPSLKYSKPVNLSQSSESCNCRGGCQPGDQNCHCIQKNGGFLPYTSLGVLLSYKSVIYECGPLCLCPSNCRIRISQAGLKARLEVFRTKHKGWGLRSWDPIRAGAFICEYAGEVIDKSAAEVLERANEDNYIFDATRYYQPMEATPGINSEPTKVPYPIIINAKDYGNVARFMNHSCTPNVYWQPVLRESDNESYLHIAFFAITNIPPMKELTYDYGTIQSGNAVHRRKNCLCGSVVCRGHFY